MPHLYDMHCHLGSMSNADQVADDARRLNIVLLNVTACADDADACERLSPHPNVYRAAGLHPWWVANGTCGEEEIAHAASRCAASRYVGEIGMDLSEKYRASAAQQHAAFARIIEACARNPVEGRLFSIHAVKAVQTTLATLQRYGITQRDTCIFHWFSGSSDELTQARKAGCYFSVNRRMLATKRGREYARQIPFDRLLLETDAPRTFGERGDAALICDDLAQTLTLLSEIRGTSAASLQSRIEQTSQSLLF